MKIELDINVYLHGDEDKLKHRLDHIDRALLSLLSQGVNTMATIAEVNAKLDAVVASTDALATEVGEEVVIIQEIKAALDALVAGGGATAAELQALADKLDGVATGLAASTAALDTAGNAADITP